MLDWLRLWPEFIRLNLRKEKHRRHVRTTVGRRLRPAPCQSASDTGLGRETRCEACQSLDRPLRLRLACPDLVQIDGEARCSRDATDLRPYWGRAALALLLPPLALYACVTLAWWGALRFQGVPNATPLDTLAPFRWARLAELRRTHFIDTSLQALARGDAAGASVALASAAQVGRGDTPQNRLLARLAYLSGQQTLGDQLHAAILDAAPDNAPRHAVAWHDDLLVFRRPARLAALALSELARPQSSREFWLRAYFESLRHPGVAASLDPVVAPRTWPHPGLREAALARIAFDNGDLPGARAHLDALARLPPGRAAQGFLVLSRLDLGDTAAALAATAPDPHASPRPAETARLRYLVYHQNGDLESARAQLAQSLPSPPDAASLEAALVCLVRAPDACSLRDLRPALDALDTSHPRRLAIAWLAARAAEDTALAAELETRLGATDPSLLASLHRLDQAPTRHGPDLATLMLPVDREALYALHSPALPSASKRAGKN